MAETILARPMLIEEFAPLVGQIFEVDCKPRTALLTLIDVKPARWQQDEQRPPFRLLFESAPDVLLVSGTYAMQCGTFGPDVIYITPVTKPADVASYHYEAVFN